MRKALWNGKKALVVAGPTSYKASGLPQMAAYILGGTSASEKDLDKKDDTRGGNDYWIIKLNAKGNEEWQQTFVGDGQDDLLTMIPSRGGGYVVAGSSSSAATRGKTTKHNGNMDYWLLQLDSKGKVQWQHSYGGDYADLLRSVEATLDGGYILGGYSNSTQSGDKSSMNYGEGGDYWIIKIDAQGSIEWQQTLGGDKDDQLYALHQTADQGSYLCYNKKYEISIFENSNNRQTKSGWQILSGRNTSRDDIVHIRLIHLILITFKPQ